MFQESNSISKNGMIPLKMNQFYTKVYLFCIPELKALELILQHPVAWMNRMYNEIVLINQKWH